MIVLPDFGDSVIVQSLVCCVMFCFWIVIFLIFNCPELFGSLEAYKLNLKPKT